MTAAAVGGVLLLTAGLIGGMLISRSQDPDPRVTAWHEKARPAIGAVLSVMLSKAPTSGVRLRAMCETLSLALNDINSADDAPQADVNAKFRTWAALLTGSVSDCAASADLPDAEALEAAKKSFEMSSRAFDEFMMTLDLYFDFSVKDDSTASRPIR